MTTGRMVEPFLGCAIEADWFLFLLTPEEQRAEVRRYLRKLIRHPEQAGA